MRNYRNSWQIVEKNEFKIPKIKNFRNTTNQLKQMHFEEEPSYFLSRLHDVSLQVSNDITTH